LQGCGVAWNVGESLLQDFCGSKNNIKNKGKKKQGKNGWGMEGVPSVFALLFSPVF
jgi:hypothetical protein